MRPKKKFPGKNVRPPVSQFGLNQYPNFTLLSNGPAAYDTCPHCGKDLVTLTKIIQHHGIAIGFYMLRFGLAHSPSVVEGVITIIGNMVGPDMPTGKSIFIFGIDIPDNAPRIFFLNEEDSNFRDRLPDGDVVGHQDVKHHPLLPAIKFVIDLAFEEEDIMMKYLNLVPR
jgi:hypothetical protein